MFMTHFSVEEQVIIRWGRQLGQKAKILNCLVGDEYKVKIEDGSIGYFIGKGLKKEKERIQQLV